MEKERFLKKNEKVSKIYHIIQCVLFFCILLCGCVVGFLMPLRPKMSDLEKRTLTEFPKFSKQGFLDGSYLKDMDTWYADTFPFRDQLLAVNSDIQELYGLRGQQIHGGGNNTGDEIPTAAMTTAESKEPETTVVESSSAQTTTEQTAAPQVHGSIYVDGKQAYGIYYFNLDAANLFID